MSVQDGTQPGKTLDPDDGQLVPDSLERLAAVPSEPMKGPKNAQQSGAGGANSAATQTVLGLSAEEYVLHAGDEETVADTVGEDSESLGTPPEGPRRLGLISAHNRKIVALPFVVALVFFFGPAAAFLAGDRADEIDNRPLVAFPSASAGWAFFAQFQAWANDYLPLRSQAVKAGTLLSENIFREPPQYGNGRTEVGVPGVSGNEPDATGQQGGNSVVYPRVIGGQNGWLYLGSDVSAVCQAPQPVNQVVANLARLSDAVISSGRRMVIVVPPDKSSAVPENLPETFAGKDCMIKGKGAFWQAVAAASGLTVIDPRGALAKAEVGWGETVWRKGDTHWGPRGAVTFAEEVVGAIDRAALADTTISSPGPRSLRADLSAMLGKPTEDVLKDATITRPGVTVLRNGQPVAEAELPDVDRTPQTVTASSTQAPLISGRTLVIGDSFLQGSKGKLAPFFERMTYLHNMTASAPGGQKTVIDAMLDSDTVVLEVVERSAVGGSSSLQQPDTVDAIEKALAAKPR